MACCITILGMKVRMLSHGGNEEAKAGMHMLSMPDAEEVLPRRRNHGLNPSEEPLEMMR
jgi:hypothetical protein